MKILDLFINNPQLTKGCENISFKDYIESKEINNFEIVVTKDSPKFNIKRNLDFTSITIEGCLLKKPVCGKPKLTQFLDKFYLRNENLFTVTIESSPEINKQDEERYERIFCLNKKYNTKYTSLNNKDLNIGEFTPYYSKERYFLQKNYITIYNSHTNYLKFFYDNIVNQKNCEIHISLAIQNIAEWKNFYPIIDLKINGPDRHFEEILKKDLGLGYGFDNFQFPSEDNILKVDDNLDMEDEIDFLGFKVKKR